MKLSVLRRLFHFSGVIIPITYLLLGKNPALVLTTIVLVLLALAEFLRIGLSLDSPFLRKHLKEKEMKNPTGSVPYMVSCLLVILLFDRLTAVASILVLVLSDPVASIIGSRLGRRHFLGKSVQGTIAFFLCSVLVLTFFPFGIAARLAAAIAATVAEFLSSRFVDDNLTIPLATAVVLTILAR
jgi:dolichol kinase